MVRRSLFTVFTCAVTAATSTLLVLCLLLPLATSEASTQQTKTTDHNDATLSFFNQHLAVQKATAALLELVPHSDSTAWCVAQFAPGAGGDNLSLVKHAVNSRLSTLPANINTESEFSTAVGINACAITLKQGNSAETWSRLSNLATMAPLWNVTVPIVPMNRLPAVFALAAATTSPNNGRHLLLAADTRAYFDGVGAAALLQLLRRLSSEGLGSNASSRDWVDLSMAMRQLGNDNAA